MVNVLLHRCCEARIGLRPKKGTVFFIEHGDLDVDACPRGGGAGQRPSRAAPAAAIVPVACKIPVSAGGAPTTNAADVVAASGPRGPTTKIDRGLWAFHRALICHKRKRISFAINKIQ